MTKCSYLNASIATVLAVAGLAGPATSAGADVPPARAAELGTQAYVYGYPLMEFLRVRKTATSVACPDRMGNAPVNTFSHTPRFARPQDRTVVAPNVDTLYSIAHLDLGDGPVVLEHPDMGDRYFVLQLLDPYTNTLGYVGSRTTGSKAGRFAITWTGAPAVPEPGVETITVAHRFIWIIGRVVSTDDPADQKAANALIRRYTLSPPGGPLRFKRGCKPGAPVEASSPGGLGFLDALSGAMRDSPPPERDAALLSQLTSIGVGPGRRVGDAGLSGSARSALRDAVRSTAKQLPTVAEDAQLKEARKHRGWAVPQENIGDYGTDYLFRAGVAYLGLGANTPEEAAYQTAFLDGRLRRLHGRNTYRLRFAAGHAPPTDAFWSITVYDDEGFLYETSTGRHSVGDTHSPLRRRGDGSVDIIFSPRKPANPAVNWLEVPKARFRVYLRMYVPRVAILDGSWRPPGIQRLHGPGRGSGTR